jgi:hypothetical protein
MCAVSVQFCDEIARLRRKFRRIGAKHLLFLDETGRREGETANYTIVLPGYKAFLRSSNVTSYAPRYDMIAVTANDRVLLPTIFSPTDRQAESAKGINGKMLLKFIDDVLAQAVEGLNRYPLTLILDRATIHRNTDAILQAFRDRSCYAIKDIIILPPLTAKRLSPLDNSMFAQWKRECHERGPLTRNTVKRVMNDAWSHLDPAPYYRHCGLTGHRDVYFDCPDPLQHKHPKKRKGETPPSERSVRPRTAAHQV